MGFLWTLLTCLVVVAWAGLLFLSYTIYRTQTRFVLQTLFILPNALISCTISGLVGLFIKYFTINAISEPYRVFILSHITHQFWQYLLFTLEFWTNLKYVVSDENVSDDMFYLNSIIVSNHSETPFDWIVLGSFADYLDRFRNSFVFMKRAFAYVPLVGWIGSLMSAVPLDRDWDKDKIRIKKLAQTFKSNTDYKLVTPWIWFFYPEGTRLTRKKLLDAQEFAKKRGFPVYEHLLQPRVKGFSYLAHHLYDALGTITDVTCCYHPRPPQAAEFFLNTRLGKYVHVHLRVYRQNDIPRLKDDSDLSEMDQWLRDRWTEKDKLMDQMKKKEIKHTVLKRSPLKAMQYYVMWNIVVAYFLYYLTFNVPFLVFVMLLVAALFPALIVAIEHKLLSL